MIAYLDASVVLRLVLGEPGRLREIDRVTSAVSSELVQVECLRTLDRLRHQDKLTEQDLAERRGIVIRFLEAVEEVDITRPILARASDPFPTSLGTLDAIHLATALAYRDARRKPIVMATHDTALGLASRAVGLEVLGC